MAANYENLGNPAVEREKDAMMGTRIIGHIGLLLVLAMGRAASADDNASVDGEFFEKQIRPLLVARCQSCHGDKKQEGNLRLTSRESLLRGGDSGPAVVPGKPEMSLLIKAVGYVDSPKMPPTEKLPDAEIEKLQQWVAMGALWPEPSTSSGGGEPSGGFTVSPKQREWWAFQAVRDVALPVVHQTQWPRNEVDQFILAAMESHGLSPAPPADRRTWLRRVTFDLTGLPPTPAEVDAFNADDTDQAFDRVVDRLLASPAYGQRWTRHWLDLVRYADYHDGNPATRVASCEPLEAFRYRDWVVDSLNRDLPFDQFVTHQIAGDLLPSPNGQEPYVDGLVATTFLVNGSWDRGDADKEKMLSDMVDDQIDTIGKVFLGLTLGCARCHDHKFDPISNEDYYALAGIFYSTRIMENLGTKGGEITLKRVPIVSREVAVLRAGHESLLKEVNDKLAALDKVAPPVAADHPERLALIRERDALQSAMPPPVPVALAVQDGGMPGSLFPNIQDVPIHIRGSYTRLGKVVPRRMPGFFAGDSQPPITQGSGRRELAAWVASPSNPLTARVIVNRIWQGHFGEGLVRTPNNLGLLSEPPSHPELLDWLATRFVKNGWSLKNLHRRIVLSATYRQESLGKNLAPSRELDPENRWLGRFSPRRLEAEEIRDSILAVTGQLDLTSGGPASDNLAISRRSLYVQTARWDRGNFALLFDAANPDASVEKRTVSTVAPQSLFLLNNQFTLDQAKQLAERLAREVPDDSPNMVVARTQWAYRLLFQRAVTDEELEIVKQLLSRGNWEDLAHVLLCSNEFLYID